MSRQLADKLRVRVLRRHITKGLKGLANLDSVSGCVVAEALKERFPREIITVGMRYASVGLTGYTISPKGANLIGLATAIAFGDKRSIKPTTIALTKGI